MVGVSRATAQWRYTLNKAPDCPTIGVHLTLTLILNLAFMLAMTSARGSDRLTVVTDNDTEIEVKDCLALAVKAVNDEDVDAFLDCFPASQHSRRRRETGLWFVRHEMGMELLAYHQGENAFRHRGVLLRARQRLHSGGRSWSQPWGCRA